jgi:hypothetical protein
VADVTGMTVIKQFNYRDDPNEEWSNKYYFSGASPSSSGAWRALFDALAAEERKLYGPGNHIVRGYAYNDDAENADSVWSVDLTVPPETEIAGTLDNALTVAAPGDAAVWCRWTTARMARGKHIYLRKYFHGAERQQSAAADVVATVQRDALTAFATKMTDGTFIDGRVIRSRANAESLLGIGVSQYITTRTLKRRRKKKET